MNNFFKRLLLSLKGSKRKAETSEFAAYSSPVDYSGSSVDYSYAESAGDRPAEVDSFGGFNEGDFGGAGAGDSWSDSSSSDSGDSGCDVGGDSSSD